METTLSNKVYKSRWIITAAIFMVAVGQCLMLYGVSAFLTTITEELSLSGAQVGMFTGLQNLVNMFYFIVGTAVAIKLGTKKCYALGSVLTFVSAILFFIGSYPSLLAARAVLGIGQGMTLSLVAAVFNQVFGADKKGATLATGIYGAGAYFGRYVSLAITFPIMRIVGSWQRTFFVLGLVGLIGTVLWLVAYPSAEEYQGRNKESSALSETISAWKTAWKNSTVRKFAMYFLCSGFSGVVFNTFSVALIIYKFGFEASVASGAVAYSGLAGMAGSLLGGFVASRSRVKNVIIPAEFISGFCMISVCFLKDPSIGLLCAIVSLHGFCNGAQSCNNISLMYKQTDLSTQEIVGGISLIMTLFKFSCYLTTQIFGMVYPSIGMDKAMLIWAIPVLVGACIVCTIKEPKISELKEQA
nr:MFS transporter [uncultured Oscillibacter sp.]